LAINKGPARFSLSALPFTFVDPVLFKETEMDWRVFLTTFGVIFLAEMGDKTQLAAMTMAAQSKKPWAVFIAAALALTAVSAIGVIAGSVLGNYLPLVWIKRGAAVAFILIGILILAGKF
jgi:putative Ca2+/H+ antiporter (TMEM165/GDT1 family)